MSDEMGDLVVGFGAELGPVLACSLFAGYQADDQRQQKKEMHSECETVVLLTKGRCSVRCGGTRDVKSC